MSKRPNKTNPISFFPLFISGGMALGLMFGEALGNIPMGICLGMGIGAIGAAVFIAVAVSKNKKDGNDTENK